MADKKGDSKPDAVVDVGFVLVICIFLVILWTAILNYFLLSRFGSWAAIWAAIVAWFFKYLWPIILVLSVILCLFLIYGIVSTYRKLLKLNEEENEIYALPAEIAAKDEPLPEKNKKWESIEKHLISQNPSDWRLAVIEADVMLDELLRAQGYHGDSIGEMLKGVERSDMRSLDHAWEAHKVRNELVHSGSEYALNEREAKRVLSLYESVFREFKLI